MFIIYSANVEKLSSQHRDATAISELVKCSVHRGGKYGIVRNNSCTAAFCRKRAKQYQYSQSSTEQFDNNFLKSSTFHQNAD